MNWYPGDYGKPTYPRPIRVVDGVRATLGTVHRAAWTKLRNEALGLWQIGFDISAGPIDLEPDQITLMRYTDWWPCAGPGSACGGVRPPSTGFAVFRSFLWKPWDYRQMRAQIAHEVGHALGFGHGGTGIMAGAWRPNEEELTALRSYYS